MTRTIPELFEAAVADVPDKVWLLHERGTWTYAQARMQIARGAAALSERGATPGAVVMAPAPNEPEYVFLWLAAMYAGAVYVAVDPRATPAELAGLRAQVQPAVFVDDARALLARTPGEIAAPLARSDDDGAVLIPTSGTTGRSKLVTQTHRAYVMAAEGFPWWLELTSEDRLMTSLPLFHLNAPAYSILGSVQARASVVLLPRFSASGFLDAARRFGATQFNAIGAMLEILMRAPERPDDADNPLRLCYTGPSPTKERQLEIERRFGLRVVGGYALSETTYGTIWRHGTRPYGTIGSVRQHPTLGCVNEGRVVGDDDRPVPVGRVGELHLRNPCVMKGYWNMPEQTAEVLLPDGWLRTGDLVRLNADDTYTFIGRRKEVIRRRGENVAPAEIEEALASHPDVVEAAVVGVPSELSEEEIKGFVVLRDGDGRARLDAIREHAATRLTRFKVPRYLEVLAELPHTPTGRIAKHRLPRERTPQEVDFE